MGGEEKCAWKAMWGAAGLRRQGVLRQRGCSRAGEGDARGSVGQQGGGGGTARGFRARGGRGGGPRAEKGDVRDWVGALE